MTDWSKVTYEFLIPSRLIPSLKKAARDMDVKILSANKWEGTGDYLVKLSAAGPFDLISIGRLMAMDEALCIVNEPLLRNDNKNGK
jgi:hypothetical protein